MSTTSQQPVGDQPMLDGLVEEVALRERVRTRYAELAELAAAGATGGCGQPVDCGCGADCCTPADEYQDRLAAAGFTEVSVTFTHPVADGVHSAVIKATKPADATAGLTATGRELPVVQQSGCC